MAEFVDDQTDRIGNGLPILLLEPDEGDDAAIDYKWDFGVNCDMGVSEELAGEVWGDAVEYFLTLDRQWQGLPDSQMFFWFYQKVQFEGLGRLGGLSLVQD